MIELFTQYKARQAGKATFRVSAYQTSQECAECEHTHSDNRTSQETFECVACHHVDNADNNASKVIKSRAIKLIKDSGTE
ncbi:MAG: transposase, partial [Endozoicomonadaceae bacterium]|nr:transposase [Endozoicomonadaceae bacterium]